VAALITALEGAGHLVQVDPPTSWYRGSSGLDDVTVFVGGGAGAPSSAAGPSGAGPSGAGAVGPWVPQPGARNVVWLAAGQHVVDGDFAVVVAASDGVDGVLRAF